MLRRSEIRVQEVAVICHRVLRNLDIGLPTDQLRSAIRTAFNGNGDVGEVVLAATNRRGKPIACKVTATPMLGVNKEVCGVILMMEDQAAAERFH